MAGGTYAKVPFHDSFEGEPWSAKQRAKAKAKAKGAGEGTNRSLYSTGLVYSTEPSGGGKGSANSLDKAAFLIDGLTSDRPCRGLGLLFCKQLPKL
jgi:hypothetical protein